MTNKQKLEKAKKDYPKGTKFRLLGDYNEISVSSGIFKIRPTGAIYDVKTEFAIFSDSGRWTEIVKEETLKERLVSAEVKKEAIETKSNVLLDDMEEIFNNCLSIARNKNNDYAGKEAVNPFANFKGSEIVGVSVEKGILVRLMDKMKRVSNLLSQEAMVKDESIDDTLNDMINYVAILKSYIKQKRLKVLPNFIEISLENLSEEDQEKIKNSLNTNISIGFPYSK